MIDQLSLSDYLSLYRSLRFKLGVVEPRGKMLYPKVLVREALRSGSEFNVCALPNGRHLWLDCDVSRLNPILRKVAAQTLTSRGNHYGFCLSIDGGVPSWFLDVVMAQRERWECATWEKSRQSEAERRLKILEALGFVDQTAVHGVPNLENYDGYDFYLLPLSTTCKYHNGKVRDHSSSLCFCNRSPDGKHHWITRTFLDSESPIMSVAEFGRILKLI